MRGRCENDAMITGSIDLVIISSRDVNKVVGLRNDGAFSIVATLIESEHIGFAPLASVIDCDW